MHSSTLTTTPDLLIHLRAWEGRTKIQEETLALPPLRGLAATLDCEVAASAGEPVLPPLWHWLYFLPGAPQRELGADGHPKRGGFMPPVPLPRRMWAGGRLQWNGDLRAGDSVRRTSRIASVTHKAGRTGDLVFVVVRHEIQRGHELVLTEEQDIVYRAPARPGEAAPSAQVRPAHAAWTREIVPDPALLFRYSALTFNSHRIHYDRPYATAEEGYPGLVVHGPLIATLLADLARRTRPAARVSAFRFKALRPAIDLQPLRLCGEPDGNGAQLWALGPDGGLVMQAEINFF